MKLAAVPKPVGRLRHTLFALVFATIAIPSSANSLFAADYSVELGIDSHAGKDAGTAECVRDTLCSVQLEPLGLRVSVYLPSRERHTVSVSMDGNEVDCCFFDGAARSIEISPGSKLSQLLIYRGRQAKGAVFIQNEYVGILYLRIQRH
ncbi:MAG: hypothetical protein QM736_13660 [Vicinamibacterales bacterium]